MSYSRKQLEAFGEPFGESATRKEAGRIIYGGGGSQGGGSSTQVTDLPDWAKPYAQKTLGFAESLAFKKDDQGNVTGMQPYQTYDRDRFAGFSPMQQKAQETAFNMGTSGQLGTGTGLATAAGLMGLGANYQPGYFANQFRAPAQYQPSQFGMMSAQAPNLQQFQMGPAERVQGGQYEAPMMDTARTGFRPDLQAFQMGPAQQVQGGQYATPEMAAAQTQFRPDLEAFQMGPAERAQTQSFTQPGSAESYMSPFMQNVVDKQTREAERQAGLAAKQERAASIQRGAFGGGRTAVREAAAARDLAQLKSDIYGTGQQTAFQNAQQQFNAEQQARMQAQLANQQAGLTTGQQNLAARLGVQQLGTQTGMQTALANLSNQQQAAVQNQAAQLQTQGMSAQQAMQAALANQQAGLTVGQQNLAAQQATQQLGTQTGLQAALANLSAEQQANVQNQAAQLQTQGLTANQAMQAAMANQQAGLTTGQQNLAAQLGVQQLGSGQNMQAQLANQQAYQNMLQQREASRQFGYGQQMTAAQQRAQFGQAAQQLAEQSRQFGAGYGQQGLNTALQAAGQLGNLGQAEFGQQKDIVGLQSQLGGQQQALRQQGLTQAYQDFLNEQNYPYKQLGFMSDMIRGLPLGQQTTRQVYEAPGSALGQIAGLGVGLGGMARFGQMFAEGGEVKEYADGGRVDSPENVAKIVDKLSDEQLNQAEEAARARGDFAQVQAIIAERGMRASERSGMAGAFNSLPQETQEAVTEMASGGIVAFAGPSDDNNNSLVQDPQFGGASAGSMDMDRLRIESDRARRAAQEDEARMRFLRESAPEVHQRIMAGRPSAPVQAAPAQAPRAAQAAPQPARRDEPRRAATITRQEARRAVETIAQGNNVEIPKDDTKELTEQFMKEFSAKSAPERAEVKADLEKAKNRAKEIEARGIGEAMMRFGFGMAAAASKPGAGTGLGGALRSAAAASPIFAESLAETNKLKQAAEDNYTKLRMENRRYENALDQGNMQLASNLANNINQRKLAQANLERQIVQQDRMFDLEKQKTDFARSQAGRPGSSLEMAYNVLRADPKNKDKSNSDLLEDAARKVGSASLSRTDTNALIQAEKLKTELLDKRRLFASSDTKTAKEQVRLIDEQIRGIDARLGLRGGVGSGATTGWSIEPVAGGR
jgi:hypothetical protein